MNKLKKLLEDALFMLFYVLLVSFTFVMAVVIIVKMILLAVWICSLLPGGV